MNFNIINVHIYNLFGGLDLMWNMGCITVKKVKEPAIIENFCYK
jgi:hypothetical protein